jgi:hypothetical protein
VLATNKRNTQTQTQHSRNCTGSRSDHDDNGISALTAAQRDPEKTSEHPQAAPPGQNHYVGNGESWFETATPGRLAKEDDENIYRLD